MYKRQKYMQCGFNDLELYRADGYIRLRIQLFVSGNISSHPVFGSPIFLIGAHL